MKKLKLPPHSQAPVNPKADNADNGGWETSEIQNPHIATALSIIGKSLAFGFSVLGGIAYWALQAKVDDSHNEPEDGYQIGPVGPGCYIGGILLDEDE